jgi:hypothetical protein
MNHLSLFQILLLLLLFAFPVGLSAADADTDPSPELTAADCQRFLSQDPTAVVVALIDVSGSVVNRMPLSAAISDLIDLMESTPPGYQLYVRYVTEDSFSDKNLIYTGIVPPVVRLGKPPTNRYDPAAVRRYRIQKGKHNKSRECVALAKNQIMRDLRSLQGPSAPTGRTDLFGALAAADAILAGNSGMRLHSKLVLVYSDLEDTAGHFRPRRFLGLEGADILVRTTLGAVTPARAETLQIKFRAMLDGSASRRIEFASLREIPCHVAMRLFAHDEMNINPLGETP